MVVYIIDNSHHETCSHHDFDPRRTSRMRDALGCTTQLSKTHISEVRVVQYPWHPWHGKPVIVAVTKNRERMAFSCRLEECDYKPCLEIPQWMFDPAVCRMKLAPAAVVDWEHLLELQRLLHPLVLGRAQDGVEDQQGSFAKKGVADGQNSSSSGMGPESVVSAGPSAAELADVSFAGSGEGDSRVGATAERSARQASRRQAKGGGQ